MAHTDTQIDGIDYPSVTQIAALAEDKSRYLVPWAARHGTLKLKAFADIVASDYAHDPNNFVNLIPDEWFEDNRIERENFWKSHDELGKAAQDTGKEFHEDVENYLRHKFNLPPIKTMKLDLFAYAVECWADVVGFTPVEFEKKVISKTYLYGGTYDCLGKVNDVPVLVDWKRTSQIGISYAVQLGGYVQAHYEETGEWIDDCRIVRPYELKKVAKASGHELTSTGCKWSFAGSNIFIEERRYTDMQKYVDVFLKLRDIWDFANQKGAWAK